MSTSYASCSILQRAQVRCSFQSGFPCLALLIRGGLTPTGMARCFCAMGLTEHAAQDLETLRRDAESAYRQMSRSTHPDRVGLGRPSQDFLFLTSVKNLDAWRRYSKGTPNVPFSRTGSEVVVLPHLQQVGGLTPPPASYLGAGAAHAPPWAGGSYQRATQQPEKECMFPPWSAWPGWTAISLIPGWALDGPEESGAP